MILEKVKERIKRELKRIKSSYELEYVCRLNDIKADEYLYLVIAIDTNANKLIPEKSRYIVYTYNDSRETMNYGHYYITLTDALEIIMNKRKEYEI